MKNFIIIFSIMSAANFSNAQEAKQAWPATTGISYHVADPKATADYYRQFGFSPVTSKPGNIILSDGSLLLHFTKSQGFLQKLGFYAEDPASVAEGMKKLGAEVKENNGTYLVTTPDGPYIEIRSSVGVAQPAGKNLATMGSALQDPGAYPNKECGAFGEWAIPVKDIDKSIAFWEKLGFKLSMKQEAPYPHAILMAGSMLIGLHQTTQFNEPGLTYFAVDMKERINKLKAKGITDVQEVAGEGNVAVSVPGGPKLFLFSF